ncbi:MAG: SDR family oxidoreductase [Betaproteobacteria bacterium]|nr:SDR family oxidoreductase [Betaproteobacteria bacterium]
MESQSLMPDAARRVAERFSMAGRRALITGGSLSIGRAIVLAFADAGADVAIQYAASADTSLESTGAAQELGQLLAGRGVRHGLIDADFFRSGEGTRTVREAEAMLGGVDVLVLCASVQQRETFAAISATERERQTRINFDASVELLQAVVPGMQSRGWGRILAIGSVNQTRPDPELAIYAALKSAQHNLTLNLARQLAPHGVTVNNLSPGLVVTARNRWRRVDAAQWKRIERKSSPMGRAGTPEEIAGAALLLCSEAGSFITGADLQITGGAHL